MANTHIAIQTATVGSGGQSSIAFNSIPGTYTDLLILLSCRSDQSYIADEFYVTVNSSTSSFTWSRLYGLGTTVDDGTGSTNLIGATNGANSTSSHFSNAMVYIPAYTNTSYDKTFLNNSVVENNAARGDFYLYATKWGVSNAITSIEIKPTAGNWVQYSTATLYGIKNS
jgi:hypothetical protein